MKEYYTDKFSHGYIPFYEKYFTELKNVKNILEIGVYRAESLSYLKDRFPNSQIHGIDIEDKSEYDSDRIKTYIVDQEDREQLTMFIEETNVNFDIVIDDGGHTMRQQQISFGVLFKKISPNGIYILEDLHTSRMENFGTIFESDLITSLDMILNFKYTKNLISNHMSDDEKRYIKENTKSVEVWSSYPEYRNSTTSIIKKK
jgi:hypothetical protein